MRLLVTGPADYCGDGVLWALDRAHAKRPLSMVLHGSSGAGLLAEGWAQQHGVMSARLVSGDVMAAEPDGVLAMPGAPAGLLEKARAGGVKVWMPYWANKEE